MKKALLFSFFAAASTGAMAQRSDSPCNEMIKPLPDGGVQKTCLRRWD
jgi:hypothetical protein